MPRNCKPGCRHHRDPGEETEGGKGDGQGHLCSTLREADELRHITPMIPLNPSIPPQVGTLTSVETNAQGGKVTDFQSKSQNMPKL